MGSWRSGVQCTHVVWKPVDIMPVARRLPEYCPEVHERHPLCLGQYHTAMCHMNIPNTTGLHLSRRHTLASESCFHFRFKAAKVQQTRRTTTEPNLLRTQQARILKASTVTRLAQQRHEEGLWPPGPPFGDLSSTFGNTLTTVTEHNAKPPKQSAVVPWTTFLILDWTVLVGWAWYVQQAVVRCASIVSGVHTGVNV